MIDTFPASQLITNSNLGHVQLNFDGNLNSIKNTETKHYTLSPKTIIHMEN